MSFVYSHYTRVTDRRTDGKAISVAQRLLYLTLARRFCNRLCNQPTIMYMNNNCEIRQKLKTTQQLL